MSPRQESPRSTPLLIGAAAVVAIAALLVLLVRDGSAPPDPAAPTAATKAPADPPAGLQARRASDEPRSGRPRVDVEPRAIGRITEPEGDGRVARLVGRITVRDRPRPGTRVAIVAGVTGPAETTTAEDGSFELARLLPGRVRVTVATASGARCEREVLLRRGPVARLTVDFGVHGTAAGEVTDAGGTPLAGARVSCDGAAAVTDGAGAFALPRTTSGNAEMLVGMEGFATRRVRADGGPPADGGPGRRIRLRRGGDLEVILPPLSHGGEATVLVLPHDGTEYDHPWHTRTPFRLAPGSARVLADLPPGLVEVQAHHAFAFARATATVSPDETLRVDLVWRELPILRGFVRRDDDPVAGAIVQLTARDAYRATERALGNAGHQLRDIVLVALPAALQETLTDERGAFRVGFRDLAGVSRTVAVRVENGPVRAMAAPAGDAPLVIDLAADR